MYLDSSFHLCPRCNQYVLLDQTQGECAREHGCDGGDCPLARFFTGEDFDGEQAPEPGSEDPHRA